MQSGLYKPRRYETLGGLTTATSTTTASQTGLTAGRLYEFVADQLTLVRWGATAAANTDGSFDFAVPAGYRMVVEAQGVEINAILTTGTGTLIISELSEYKPG